MCLVQCIINKNNAYALKCPSRTCVTNRHIDQVERSCGDSTLSGVTTLTIGTKISIAKNDKKQEQQKLKIIESLDIFLYTCHSNNCNNNKTDENINQVLKDHYNLSSFHQIINNKFNPKYLPELTTTLTTTSTTLSTTLTTFPNNSFIINNNSILNIIFIYNLIYLINSKW